MKGLFETFFRVGGASKELIENVEVSFVFGLKDHTRLFQQIFCFVLVKWARKKKNEKKRNEDGKEEEEKCSITVGDFSSNRISFQIELNLKVFSLLKTRMTCESIDLKEERKGDRKEKRKHTKREELLF
jgi:hypothetical protein